MIKVVAFDETKMINYTLLHETKPILSNNMDYLQTCIYVPMYDRNSQK